MTNEERESLLRKVAEVAPKEMQAKCSIGEYYGRVYFYGVAAWGDFAILSLSGNDCADSSGIIAMLDAMRKVEWVESVTIHMSGDEVVVTVASKDKEWEYEYEDRAYFEVPSRIIDAEGDALSEAVSRAFVKVFDKEEPREG